MVIAGGRSQMSEARGEKPEVRNQPNENDLAVTMTKDCWPLTNDFTPACYVAGMRFL
jgi:hypothetical protein